MDQVFAIKAVFAFMLLAGEAVVQTEGVNCDIPECQNAMFLDTGDKCTYENGAACFCNTDNCNCAPGFFLDQQTCRLLKPELTIQTNVKNLKLGDEVAFSCRKDDAVAVSSFNGYAWYVNDHKLEEPNVDAFATVIRHKYMAVSCQLSHSSATHSSPKSDDVKVIIWEEATVATLEKTTEQKDAASTLAGGSLIFLVLASIMTWIYRF